MQTDTTSDVNTDEPQPGLATILLVDDDAKLLKALKRHLDDNYQVLTAISPGEACAFLVREKVDLIVSDNLMSGELGTEFLKSISEKFPHIKLLMLSGYVPEVVAERVINDYGVQQVLIKPCAITDVELAIQQALK